MPIFLSRVLGRLVFLRSWATPLVVSAFVFLTAWPLLALTEGADSPIVHPANYWWWFVVTSSTVGYGDFFPESASGHVVGAYVIVGGIVTLTTIFTKLVSVLENARGRLMQGAITVDAAHHIVLLGYTPGRTERITDRLLADGARVVLCAWDEVASHPMADRDVDFVRGDLSDVEVLQRAGVHRARTVLVDVRDDNEALAVAVAVDHTKSDCHIVVALRDMERASHMRYVDESIQCVQWHSHRMLTEELESPGIAKVYAELMTRGGANTYSVSLPEWLGPVTVGDCQTALGRRHGATVLAARSDSELLVNPAWETQLPAGAVLYYVSPRRLDPEQLAQSVRSVA